MRGGRARGDEGRRSPGRAVPRGAPARPRRARGRGEGGVRALEGSEPASPRPARAYVERAFGTHLPEVRRAMEHLAASFEPAELNRVGFRLYERFRPEVPAGAPGWGAKGVLGLARIEGAAR